MWNWLKKTMAGALVASMIAGTIVCLATIVSHPVLAAVTAGAGAVGYHLTA